MRYQDKEAVMIKLTKITAKNYATSLSNY